MLLYIILALGTWKGVLGKDDICNNNIHEACVVPDDWRFPATESDVERICPDLVKHTNCVQDYLTKCSSEDDPRPKSHLKFKALVEEGCREDSQLHARVVQNVGCLHEVIHNDHPVCQDYFSEKRDALMKHIFRIQAERGYGEDVYDEELYAPYGCLVPSLEMACMVTKSSARCGSDAGDLVLEIVGRSGFIELSCASANEEGLAEFITLLELNSEEETDLKRILGKE